METLTVEIENLAQNHKNGKFAWEADSEWNLVNKLLKLVQIIYTSTDLLGKETILINLTNNMDEKQCENA